MKTRVLAILLVAGCGGTEGTQQAQMGADAGAPDAMSMSPDVASPDNRPAESLHCDNANGLYVAHYSGFLRCAQGPGSQEFVSFVDGQPPATFYGTDCAAKSQASADNCTQAIEYTCPSKEKGSYADTTYVEQRLIKWSPGGSVGDGTIIVSFVDATGRKVCSDSYMVGYIKQ
jgi:hypothetical protein